VACGITRRVGPTPETHQACAPMISGSLGKGEGTPGSFRGPGTQPHVPSQPWRLAEGLGIEVRPFPARAETPGAQREWIISGVEGTQEAGRVGEPTPTVKRVADSGCWPGLHQYIIDLSPGIVSRQAGGPVGQLPG